MLRILRRVRRSLLLNRAFRSYALYALGEVLLVVVGILIALQINSWHNERTDRRSEAAYLQNLARDLKEQLEIIAKQIRYEEAVIRTTTTLLARITRQEPLQIELEDLRLLNELRGRKTFGTNDATFAEMRSSGHLDLIQDPELRGDLVDLYSQHAITERIIDYNNARTIDVDVTTALNRVTPFAGLASPVFETLSLKAHDPEFSYARLQQEYEFDASPFLAPIQERLQQPLARLELLNAVYARRWLSTAHVSIVVELQEQIEAMLARLPQA